MAVSPVIATKPGLVFFHSSVSGHCRRVEGFLAQVLQRRKNHGTFRLYRVDELERPDLVERFRVLTLPTLVVVENKQVRARLERPRGCREIERFLAPWLN
jgi:thioredoxin-like negative regulator of GroEL